MLQSAKEAKGDVGAGLNTDEFANLIFNTDENLDIDLNKLAPLTSSAPMYKS